MKIKVLQSDKELLIKNIKNKDVLHCGAVDIEPTYTKKHPKFWFHKFLSKHAKSLVGLDTEKKEVDELNKLGYDVKFMDAEKIKLNKKFDIIIATKIFNHLANPGLFLDNIKKHLKKKGIIYIKTPNAHAGMLLYKVSGMKFKDTDYANPKHVSIYTEFNLSFLIEKHNYKILNKFYLAASTQARVLSKFKKSLADDIIVIAEVK